MQSYQSLPDRVQRCLFDYFYNHNKLTLEAQFQMPRQVIQFESEELSVEASEGDEEVSQEVGLADTALGKRRISARSLKIQKTRRQKRQVLKDNEAALAAN